MNKRARIHRSGYGAPGLVPGTCTGEITYAQGAGNDHVAVWPVALFHQR